VDTNGKITDIALALEVTEHAMKTWESEGIAPLILNPLAPELFF